MTIKFQFTPTTEDYVECFRPFTGMGLWLTVLVSVALTAAAFYLGNHAIHQPDLTTRPDWFTPFGLLMITPMFAPAIFFLMPALNGYVLRGDVESNEAARHPVAWHMNEAQIITTTKLSEAKMDWSVYSKAVELGPYYLLINRGNQRSLTFVPKRAFESPQQESEFKALIERKLGEVQDITFTKKILPLRLQWGGFVLQLIVMLGYWVVLYWRMFL